MVAIVVAVGVTRSWQASRSARAAGSWCSRDGRRTGPRSGRVAGPVRLVVGALLLTFGSQWYRKGILIVSRDGWATGIGDEEVEEDVPADSTGPASSCRSRASRWRASRSP